MAKKLHKRLKLINKLKWQMCVYPLIMDKMGTDSHKCGNNFPLRSFDI